MTTIDDARRAKGAAKAALIGVPGVVGIGITKVGKDYALKVNLKEPLSAGVKIPHRIKGVMVAVEVVGPIHPR
jgi:hypothetical protein